LSLISFNIIAAFISANSIYISIRLIVPLLSTSIA
jgi:hypothetical protein